MLRLRLKVDWGRCWAGVKHGVCLIHSSPQVLATSVHQHPWTNQPMVSLVDNDEESGTLNPGSTVEDKKHSAQLLLDTKKKAYLG